MKKIFRLNLQAQIIFSFFVIISLSFVASFIATETIWKRSIDERNLEYRSKITNIVSDSLELIISPGDLLIKVLKMYL